MTSQPANPYSPPDAVPPERGRRLLVRRDFPFWSMGPLAWSTAALVNCLIATVGWRYSSQGNNENGTADFLMLVTVMSAVLAALYGTLYAFVISLICRSLGVLPQARIHFWTVAVSAVLAGVARLSPSFSVGFMTIAGASIAILTAKAIKPSG